MKWKLLEYIGIYIGIMENEMETTVVYWGLYRDNGKEIETTFCFCIARQSTTTSTAPQVGETYRDQKGPVTFSDAK